MQNKAWRGIKLERGGVMLTMFLIAAISLPVGWIGANIGFWLGHWASRDWEVNRSTLARGKPSDERG